MSRLMKLAEALRDIAKEGDNSEIKQALFLCSGFVDRVCAQPEAAEDLECPDQATDNDSSRPN